MTQINLFPWREYKRQQDKKQFLIMLGCTITVAVFTVLCINYYANSLVEYQTTRNNLLKKEIARLDSQIVEIKSLKQIRSELVSRMSIVQHLQGTRTLMVHLFDELIKIMPSGVYATKLERQNNIISLWGYTESNSSISMLMRNIENNAWIQNPSLTEIKNVAEKKQAANNEFMLSFILKPKE